MLGSNLNKIININITTNYQYNLNKIEIFERNFNKFFFFFFDKTLTIRIKHGNQIRIIIGKFINAL